MTAMAGSSRTLYQGSVDGWLPRYLSHVNEHGAPTRAMWTDLVFNLIVLAIASADATSFFFILAVSNCGYIIFNFLNLNAGWIHRIDNGHVARPWKAPTWLLGLGAIFAFVNAMFMGAGAKVWNPMALWAGLITAALIIPVFCFRHYIQDGGKFPEHMLADLGMTAGDLAVQEGGHAALPDAAGGLRRAVGRGLRLRLQLPRLRRCQALRHRRLSQLSARWKNPGSPGFFHVQP